MRARSWTYAFVLVTACGDSGTDTAGNSATATSGPSSASTTLTTGGSVPTTGVTSTDTGSGTDTGTTTTTATGTGTTGGLKYDLGDSGDVTTDDPPPPSCKVIGEDAPLPCIDKAPPDSFAAEVQWAWEGPGGLNRCGVTPLVANFTDDNGDGEIDLCDKPDILVVVTSNAQSAALYLFDGETGVIHDEFSMPVSWATTPALGDIDGDGLIEVVSSAPTGEVRAFEHDGTLKWTSTSGVPYGTAMALADLDADGDVEIFGANLILDHTGVLVAALPWPELLYMATTAADLDGDGDLEVILGSTAYHHDGSVYFENMEIGPGYPQVADLDGDGLPEVLVTGASGFSLLEHDGTLKPGYKDLRPTGDPPGGNAWARPATIHDFDGDGQPEFAQSSAAHYSVFEANPVSVLWSADVLDASGIAAGTAFDFLGDGIAEAMYADETTFFAFDNAGQPLMSAPRLSGTMIEYPTVADVDADGAAEVVVVSYKTSEPSTGYPCVQVLRDAQERWIPARRIWNQHTYHVTNVREDGTIPQHEPPHWQGLNTFRTQAQIAASGGVCQPEPPG